MSKDVSDSVAEKLEAAGLWRRAAARWLAVMDRVEHTDVQREWIRQRRKHCQSMVTPVATEPEKLDIAAINQAASATQARMGLSRPNGSMFRMHPEGAVKRK
ncbi:PerC family transcriptional regulator [Enterobacter sp. A11]|uniref:PerC family transcriptional regulator n=1 Tax=unclassified Enterobacter TaxID=2608935 RepID=UPI00106F8647|nr:MULTISPECIES: PerC family transcriptional regulator [unclassified Enterobacter]MBM1020212.1 PerC family transcriptional regulator [Enterobacter sp. E1]MEA3561513.1 PerC family transcriptional regulator [Enterobacter sp. GM-22]MEA3595191.1 PerC family transcriptional regulator [Enterobacter sp. GM-31]TFF60328.1 PerC family transcriptional regulator [Enterobacter sp. A11]